MIIACVSTVDLVASVSIKLGAASCHNDDHDMQVSDLSRKMENIGFRWTWLLEDPSDGFEEIVSQSKANQEARRKWSITRSRFTALNIART